MDRIDAAVGIGKVQIGRLAHLLERVDGGRVNGARVELALVALVHAVFLIGAQHDLGRRVLVAGDVGDRGRVHDRALVELRPGGAGSKVGAWVCGSKPVILLRSAITTGIAVHQRPVALPGVEVAIHGRGHDLLPPVAVDVADHRRAQEPVLCAVALAPAHVLEWLSGLPE